MKESRRQQLIDQASKRISTYSKLRDHQAAQTIHARGGLTTDYDLQIDLMKAAIEGLRKVERKPVASGWKLVPLIPFPIQWAAGQKAHDSAGMNKVNAVYEAMIEAAPKYPE